MTMTGATYNLPSFETSTGAPPSPGMNRVTADLAASCHVVSGAAGEIAKRIFASDHRSPGRSPGVDLDVLAEHCKLALRRKAIRDALLVVCLLLAFFVLVPSVIAIAIVVLVERGISYRVARRIKTGDYRFPPPDQRVHLSDNERRSLEAAKACQRGNVNVYSGFEPFVDGGKTLGGWSFAISLQRGKTTLGSVSTPVPFETAEAYRSVCSAIEELEVAGCSISDVVCANGRELRTNKTLLPDIEDRPICFVPPDFAAALIDAGDEQARLYKLVRVETWGGELVFSMYFRLRKTAETLFVETSFLVLPPIRERFRILETMDSDVSAWTLAKETAQGLVLTPLLAFGALLSALKLLDRFARAVGFAESARKRALRNDPRSDYGCNQSLRSWAAAGSYGNYFQKLDKEMFVKTIERRLLDSLEHFLGEKGIDTSDIRARQEAILNNGVIVSGNKFEASNVSIARRVQNVFSGARGAGAPQSTVA